MKNDTGRSNEITADKCPETTKVCIKCHEDKPLSAYTVDGRYADAHSNECNQCECARRRVNSAKNYLKKQRNRGTRANAVKESKYPNYGIEWDEAWWEKRVNRWMRRQGYV